ncbi:hypothetical protein [Owenweeksia hongkongensis]|uniref:hypothetical protein n=1 Tax=Owenweeksia hongkongensis TaxID=253245 RepID=UPI003A9163D4
MKIMNMKHLTHLLMVALLGMGGLQAKENVGQKRAKKSSMKVLAEGCAAATSSADLNINNVRTRILGSGDMWWDLDDAKYEVPKDGGTHSMFSGALWLGGYDEAKQLKLAAMTYRQTGVDYWPGPLDAAGSVSSETCERYNRHWIVYREEVDIHAAWIECKLLPSCNEVIDERFPGYAVPTSIEDWPGNGIENEFAYKLAPYFEPDSGGDGTPGIYDADWDYPGYDVNGTQDCQAKEVDLLYGDQTIWWVYNDKGNVHTETQAGALGFEIRAQAFAFTSNDEVNNMTFNNYRILNKSTFRLTETYFGTWFDPDLGNPRDDIIGSDISRGLGYCYNADLDDEGPNGYGKNPPAVGFDFFQGPFADYFDGLDNDRDGCIDGIRDSLGLCQDEDRAAGINERIIMSGFMYYDNVPGNQGNPDVALDFYNYLNSKWKNGNNLIIETPQGKGRPGNGDGFVPSNLGTATRFAYPGLSFDTTGAYEPSAPVDWWEDPNNSEDKRGLHCAGPFSLEPGALNFITTGVVWARNFSGGDIFASVNDVIIADDKAQQLFDNCFNVLDGPTSPDVEIVELDRELIFKLKNAYTDKTIGYSQVDPAIAGDPDWTPIQADSAFRAGYFSYKFEGFQIFQVNGPDVGVDDLYDGDQARLIFQSDIDNNIGQLINYEQNELLQNGALVPVDKTILANNSGIELTYRLKEDAFATGDRELVNNREYYFYVIAYAQNQFAITDPLNLSVPSQKTPFLAGRKIGNGQKAYLAIPSKIANRNGGTQTNSQYGDELPITRFSGAGNSAKFLSISRDVRRSIAENYKIEEIDYEPGFGPFDVNVVDPLKVQAGDFVLTFEQKKDVGNATWKITSATDPNELIAESEYSIAFLGEQIIDDFGISITFRNAQRPGNDSLGVRNNGYVGAEQQFADAKKNWLTGVPDDDTYAPTNWILAGDAEDGSQPGASYTDRPGDKNAVFESLLGGTWAPFYLTSGVSYSATNGTAGFGIRFNTSQGLALDQLPNVDVVITSDPALWTRVPVIELGENGTTGGNPNEGGASKFNLRLGRTLDKNNDGTLVPRDPNSEDATGWSYFPGYAVNVETGRRLNMAFGENSWLQGENGRDMLWNPTANIYQTLGSPAMGGMHAIYIFTDSTTIVQNDIDLTYQGDEIKNHPLYDVIGNLSNTISKLNFYNTIAWASIPLLTSDIYEFSSYANIPTEATVSLRVAKPYQRTDNGFAQPLTNNGYPQYGFSSEGRAVNVGVNSIAEDALETVRVVPNPYYGSSEYEDSQLDNVVKITNLPKECEISIFMANGTKVRTISKDTELTFVEWDLTNDYDVPIASGIYLIHINAPGIGEKVVKWMGSLRPVDLNAF